MPATKSQSRSRSRCPNGSRRNKDTGACEKTPGSKSKGKAASRSASRSDSRPLTASQLKNRKSPPLHANEFRGQVKKGIDGQMWESVANTRGVFRWVRVSQQEETSRSMDEKSEDLEDRSDWMPSPSRSASRSQSRVRRAPAAPKKKMQDFKKLMKIKGGDVAMFELIVRPTKSWRGQASFKEPATLQQVWEDMDYYLKEFKCDTRIPEEMESDPSEIKFTFPAESETVTFTIRIHPEATMEAMSEQIMKLASA